MKKLILLTFCNFYFIYAFAQSKGDAKRYIKKYNTEFANSSIESLRVNRDEKARIRSIFEKLTPCDSNLILVDAAYSSADSVLYKHLNYVISLKKIQFQKNNHSVNVVNDTILEIDNHVKFGTRFSLPQTEIDTFLVLYKNKRISLSTDTWSVFYNPSLGCHPVKNLGGSNCGTKVFYERKFNSVYCYLQGSDGGTFYSVIFIFKKGKYYGKVIYAP